MSCSSQSRQDRVKERGILSWNANNSEAVWASSCFPQAVPLAAGMSGNFHGCVDKMAAASCWSIFSVWFFWGFPRLFWNFPSGEQRRQALFSCIKSWKSPDRNGASSAGSVWQGISLWWHFTPLLQAGWYIISGNSSQVISKDLGS